MGTACLGLGTVASLAATVGWVARSRDGRRRAPRAATWALALAALAAFLILEWALLDRDFSVRYVAEHGGRDVPLYYTLTSLWSALEGSLVLWLLVLGAVVVLAFRHPPRTEPHLHPPAMAVLTATAAFFFGLVLLAGNPFESVATVPPDGPGPNPLLRSHPAMGVHPPLLYAGYVGLAVPFAYAIAALVTGRAGAGWARTVRRWTLLGWAALTAGIAVGAWWSYAVLGWGGYWAWDPVENASLLPWLTATALLHSLLARRRGGGLTGWTVCLAALTFSLVILGTFLTRSGVVGSVHAFTQSGVGPPLLAFLAAVTVGWLVLLALRGDRLTARAAGADRAAGTERAAGEVRPAGASRPWPLLSRRGALVGNNLLLAAVAATVGVGTLFPTVRQLVSGAESTVGPVYYNRALAPLALAVLALMAVGPLLAWRADPPVRIARRLATPAISAGLVAGLVGLSGDHRPAVVVVCGLAAFIAANLVHTTAARLAGAGRPGADGAGADRGSAGAGGVGGRRWWRVLRGNRRSLGAQIAHLAVAIAAVAVVVSGADPPAEQREIAIDGTATVRGVTIRLVGLDSRVTPGQERATARLEVDAGGGAPRRASPTLALLPDHGMVVATPAIDTGLRRDVYITLLAADPQAGTALLRVSVNRLIGVLWCAAGLLLVGTALAGWPRRRTPIRPAEQAAGPGSRVPVGEASR
ncbi:cytochrome c-type biogenesis CcmF C-terminal domain-containing protein [Micromonospora sp. WMMD1082]|uniref:heme lyase CcmF/NrfE family subunit n=1 Tax=Micromonospora sp. WMMD1082 TaxID=3016104 RepID=UPI002416516F|nr:cytochrome c-type biogenesis CcmF C-terminal domain-containing protein [Micromonospora sp. WMMD1082]MDG4798223.1 cytochrome c-type biogenesis CcmF C-terminal domain-containing protein [Micromonospora sp. WMMD1082]